MIFLNTSTALIFPAFVSDYNGDEIILLEKYNIKFSKYLHNASSITGIDLTLFDIQENKFIDDELKSQLLAYIFSCCVSDILKQKNIEAKYVAGYSMGIYAALYHAGVYSFEVGAKLIQKAYQTIVDHKGNTEFGMGTIAGIDDDDLLSIIDQDQLDVEIINTNSRHSFVISGKLPDVEKIVQIAAQEGALLARKLPVTVPYHSRHMKQAANDFANYVHIQKFNNPQIPIVSLIDQRLIITQQDVCTELILNVSNKINWYKTMLKIAQLDARIMLECGAGKSLYKMSKFIDEELKVFPLNKLAQFLSRFE